MGQVRYDNIVKWVLIATVAIFAIFKLKDCNKPASDFTDEEIELLNKQKDSLDNATEKILIEYDTIYMDRIVETKTKNKKSNEKVKRIPTLSDPQRDSVWAKIFSAKDSLPTRYWDLLEQESRREGN
jgi:hypothetical protein